MRKLIKKIRATHRAAPGQLKPAIKASSEQKIHEVIDQEKELRSKLKEAQEIIHELHEESDHLRKENALLKREVALKRGPASFERVSGMFHDERRRRQEEWLEKNRYKTLFEDASKENAALKRELLKNKIRSTAKKKRAKKTAKKGVR